MAWEITKDHIAEPDAKPGTNQNAIGMVGPRYGNFKTLRTVPFRMFDDDGVLYYEGVSDVDLENADEDTAFAPLYDFGMPNAGATTLQYFIDGEWQTI